MGIHATFHSFFQFAIAIIAKRCFNKYSFNNEEGIRRTNNKRSILCRDIEQRFEIFTNIFKIKCKNRWKYFYERSVCANPYTLLIRQRKSNSDNNEFLLATDSEPYCIRVNNRSRDHFICNVSIDGVSTGKGNSKYDFHNSFTHQVNINENQ